MLTYLNESNSTNSINESNSIKGNLGSKNVKLKWKSMKNAKKEPSPTLMRQMVLEIFHFKVRNLSNMDVAIL